MRLLCLLFFLLLPLATYAAPPQPNVVLIVADDLGKQLGCYGDETAHTPQIDAFAREALRFDRAYCTTASCSPSRAVLLTGLHNHASGQYGLAHSTHHFATYDTLVTLPGALKQHGYRTFRSGKFHVAPQDAYPFDEQGGGGRNGAAMTKDVARWLEKPSQQPFFLYFCTIDPHRGSANPRQDLFGNEPENPEAYPGIEPLKIDPSTMRVPRWLPNTTTVRSEWAQYYTSINRFDQGVGALFQLLKGKGLWDNTVVILLSDNGPPFAGAKTSHYEPGVQLPLLVRDPRQPASHGQSTSARVAWVDVTPTILDLCGIKTIDAPAYLPDENRASRTKNKPPPVRPWQFHGQSFADVLAEPARERSDELFLSHTNHEVTMYYPMRTLLRGPYKLIWNIAHPLRYPFASDLHGAPGWQEALQHPAGEQAPYGFRTVGTFWHRPKFELYHLESDPLEEHNLAENPDLQGVLADLQAGLRAQQEKTADPWLLKWERE